MSRSQCCGRATYFPEWLLERRKRSEAALITIIAACYLAGVSTRRMDKLVEDPLDSRAVEVAGVADGGRAGGPARGSGVLPDTESEVGR
jgi:hypothetical protein|tara:strand:+ start:2094 stop:2360 length:267 start_codon:yes stop_codon:yes gene_type:complete